MVDLLVYTNHRMGDMYYNTCILLYLVLSSTVDQTVNTVLVQLGTGEVPMLDL